MWFGTFTHTCTAPWGMVAGTYHLQGRQPLPCRRSPVSFGQIGMGVVFQGKSWDKGPSSLALPRMVHHQWPAAPDVIWHIYCSQRCFKGVLAMDLLSSGNVALTMGKVLCEIRADQPGYSFSEEELRQGSFQPCPAQDGASSMAGGSGHDLAHLLTLVLLIEGWWQGLAIFRGGSPYHGAGPLWVSSRSAILHFQPVALDVIWHIYSHLYCSLRDGGRDLPSSGEAAPTMGKVLCEFWADQP